MKVQLFDKDFSEFQNQEFLDQWKQLYIDCSWATPFQSPEFVTTWFDYYKDIYSPVIIRLENDHHVLVGLLIFAFSKENNELVVAGSHQAEYQCWLELPEHSDNFFIKALEALNKANLRVGTLKFKYLPKNTSINSLLKSKELSQYAELISHRRPLINIDVESIEKSFRKKSNKSRFNRLKKLGELDFRVISNTTELLDTFDQIIDFYDFRQGAVNNSFPFTNDPNKKDFHLKLFKRNPELLHITISTLNDTPIAAHIGFVGKDEIHLAILAYSPFYANHSPGKLHIMQLIRQLSTEDMQFLDLTPGGDPWKERFANNHDEVFELIIYKNKLDKIIQNSKKQGTEILKKYLNILKISPTLLRKSLAVIKKLNTKSIINKLQLIIPKTIEMRIYRHAVASSQNFMSTGKMQKDSLSDLLKFKATESWQDKQSFCLSALGRLEGGQHSYTISSNNRLLHYGWLIENQQESFISEVQQNYQYPPNSAVLYDFYTEPSTRGQGLYQENIKQMLADASMLDNIEYVYISVKADNIPSRHIIEKLGFEYQESLLSFKLLNFNKKVEKM